MHPNHEHATRTAGKPEEWLKRRLEVGRQSGVPDDALRRYAERFKEVPSGIAGAIEAHRALVPGVEIETDLGSWTVHETPGHAPSHVCLYQRDRRVLISGDHLLGRISLFYDYGWTPDPVGEFLRSLGVVDQLGARLCLSGHGRPFTDVHGHVEGNCKLVRERLDAVLSALDEQPRNALEISSEVYEEPLTESNAAWLLSQTLSYLRHLEIRGRVVHEPDGNAERWALA
jgi:glyoxylase-like metal-dependent hydrolase (beta-lactamase superfamily II)